MIGTCPYNCSNKTSDGYCRTIGCINLNYQQSQINQNNTLIFPVTIAGRCFVTKQSLLDFVKVHIKAIDDQTSALDKVIEDIEKEINSPNRGTCDYFIVDNIEEIIDKYKAESEG